MTSARRCCAATSPGGLGCSRDCAQGEVIRVVCALEDVTVVVLSGPVLLLTPRVRVCSAGRRRRRCAGARHVCRVGHVVMGGASRASFFSGGRRVRFRARL